MTGGSIFIKLTETLYSSAFFILIAGLKKTFFFRTSFIIGNLNVVTNLPNTLTVARILILPFFAASLMYREYDYALALFIAAAATDLLDGLTARLTNQMTYLGRILDPVADKFFIVTSFIMMTIYDLMPKWLTIVVISKDIIVVVGCIILYFVTGSLKVEPSMLGKTASACQFILIGMIILFVDIGGGVPIPMAVFLAVALLTAASGIQYIQKGLKMAAAENREDTR